jgi:benzoyl-CoA reductase/2-hydroxyglutaryl-CoA dehydratase subunit BcrC/BadD/HgdB
MAIAYKTERFQVYDKAKEVRLKHFREVLAANEQGRFVSLGNMHAPKEFIGAMFPDFIHVGGEPWAVFVTREGEETGLPTRAVEEVEKHGYTRDMCGFMRMSWGSMFLDQSPWGKPFPKPRVVIATNQCDYKGKWSQVMSEHLGVPFYCVECGNYQADASWKPHEPSIQYMVGQFHDFIGWLEKTFERPFDPDRFTQMIANTYRSRCLWAEVLQLQSHVPAPLEFKLLLPFFLAMEYWAYKQEIVDLLTEFRDETKDRIARGITPLPEERCRVMHEGLPPWYALYMFRFLREHNIAVVAGSNHVMFMPSVLQVPDDGNFDPQSPVYWEGIPKNLDEALRFRAVMQWQSDIWGVDPRRKTYCLLQALKMLKAQGVIFEQDRGCEFFSVGVPEVKRAIQQAGYAAMQYESNRVDQREWSWPHVSDALDAFVEALGIPKKPS